MRKSFALVLTLAFVAVTVNMHAQGRDIRAQRLVLDDNGADSTVNTVMIQTSSTLPQNLVLTIPDPGTGTAEFMLTSSGGGIQGFWDLDGNSGTIPGTHFLGTTDSKAFAIQVQGGSGTVANSLTLNENGSVQRDSGGNVRGANAVDLQIARSGATEVAVSNYSVIAGGENNGMTETSGTRSTIRGGRGNSARSVAATIGGGLSGRIAGAQYGVVGGGGGNRIDSTGEYAAIGGGQSNIIDIGQFGRIGGGGVNRLLRSNLSTISGGESNVIGTSGSSANYNVIMGGKDNLMIGSDDAVMGGGEGHVIEDYCDEATLGGGFRNVIGLGCASATIRGGYFTWIQRRTALSESYVTVGGGREHVIGPGAGTSNVIYATVGGGSKQKIGGNGANSTVGGGGSNQVERSNSVVPGGRSLTLNGGESFGFLANGGSMNIAESDVAVFGNANLWLANNNSRPSRLCLFEAYDTTGAFPGSAHFTSFEAPALSDTIQYILPATIPTGADQVLAVSAINGDTITLTWKADDTVSAHRIDDPPASIAKPDGNSRLESRMGKLEAQYEEQERRFEAQEQKLKALETRVSALKEEKVDR
ncbi:MAG: hypothetical protein KDD67_07150 [Ignavibacteriae bacterium]|nr:hypothetical protein [Ignavibacteriota bacterium]MCB9215254.1 hypothetical protein [Ignavibacteria bacterium]